MYRGKKYIAVAGICAGFRKKRFLLLRGYMRGRKKKFSRVAGMHAGFGK
jgi:hypothetical protein